MPPVADSPLLKRIRFRGKPKAHPESIVVAGQARFTVLTSRLIRLEWSETGQFEDRASYAFPTRHAPPPRFTSRQQGDELRIHTDALVLHYRQGEGPFSADNLSVTFRLDDKPQTWRPGTPNPGNLRGSRRTLDMCAGEAALDEGLLSRAGWVLLDDSHAVRFDEDGWVAPRPDHKLQDWYLAAYGHDYKSALADYARFGGSVPLIPRYALGAWWSRYWDYSAQDLMDLVGEFEAHDLPLDVLVVDMDWHTPDGWTGYTWNRKLFPDPPAFLQWLHDKGLRVTLNLHPAEGVQSFEEAYTRFAEAMGVDPQSGEGIPFRIADKQYVKNYFELLHHPLEDEGIDFWWMDWQQGESSEIKGLDPLPWLNHLHFWDASRRDRRPMLYSRWGGLGNHRYPIGFSGDTFAVWPALQFQPYMTATAANVCYSWWSHDIGGHMGGATEPELYARWVQFGALSPCLRLHATKDPRAERRPWKYPPEVYLAAKAAFRLRYRLIPYIYTMARVAHDSGLSLCRPMYYEHPKEDAAYVARQQYYFGDQIIVAPIVRPANPKTGLATTDVWIPKGTWIDHASKESWQGPRWVRLVGDLQRIPMLMKEGAILPQAAPLQRMSRSHLRSGTSEAIPRDRLILSVFPGPKGRFRLYEDDGISDAYQQGQYEWTEIRTHMPDKRTWQVDIAPVEGHCDALPDKRALEIRLECSWQPEQVTVDGVETDHWRYDSDTRTTIIPLSPRDKQQPTTIRAVARGPISALGGAHNRAAILEDVRRLLKNDYARQVRTMDALLDVILNQDASGRTDAIARLGGPWVHFIEYLSPEDARQQLGRVIVVAPAWAEDACEAEVSFTCFRPGRHEHYQGRIHNLRQDKIIDTPFAWDGQVRTMRWQATVQITWRGYTWSHSYHSKPLFPTVYAWQTLVYNEEEKPIALKQVLDRRGHIRKGLDWQVQRQQVEHMANLNQPHAIYHMAERERILAGEPLASYLSTTVISPEERDAAIVFGAAGPTTLYLNGRALEIVEEDYTLPGLAHFRGLCRSATVRLRKGENTLLVHTKPNLDTWPKWYFGAAIVTPEGELITDTSFE